MFQLTWEEVEALRSQNVIVNAPGSTTLRIQSGTSSRGQNIKYLPYAFTEQGVAMLSSVLRSEQAVLVNIEIMRAFVRLRQLLATHKDLAAQIETLERKFDGKMQQHEGLFVQLFEAIRQIITPLAGPGRQIGFK